MKNGNINIENGKLKRVNAITRKISVTRMKIMIIDKTLLASVEIEPFSKNSFNLNKYFSGTLLSKNKAKLLVVF